MKTLQICLILVAVLSSGSIPTQGQYLLPGGLARTSDEIPTEWVSASNLRIFSSRGSLASSMGAQPKKARFVYLVPSDRQVRDDYKVALFDLALYLRDSYQIELGNDVTFVPQVEVYQTDHSADWYRFHENGGSSAWFLNNTLADGFRYSGGYFGDVDNRWNFFVDADPACGQGVGANGVPPNGGWAVLAANDLRGLTRQQNIPQCAGDPPDNAGIYRWIGGAGHELGHTWDLPHPPGCGSGGEYDGCNGGSAAYYSWMYAGYYFFPDTYFLPEDKQKLLTDPIDAPFFHPIDLRPPVVPDFDDDRNADPALWDSSTGTWKVFRSSDATVSTIQWGTNGDKLVPGDYDGDDHTDFAVWRPDNSTWYILQSTNNTLVAVPFGLSSDTPVAKDYDGDLKTDVAVWRSATGVWYVLKSGTGITTAVQFGTNGDVPVPADFNGDRRADCAVFRPSSRVWYIYDYYLNSFSGVEFGLNGDQLAVADYDGDSKDDIAVWRPSSGNWYVLGSEIGFYSTHFGSTGDVPTPADYDGDAKTDLANVADHYAGKSTQGSSAGLSVVSMGQSSDIPVSFQSY